MCIYLHEYSIIFFLICTLLYSTNCSFIFYTLHLDIEEGKIYGFIGHNGCGKTMLFRAICNFINLTAGEIYVKDVKLQPKAF